MELGLHSFGKIYINLMKYKVDKLGWLLQIALCFSKWFILCIYINDKQWVWSMTCASAYGSNWIKGKDINFGDRKLGAIVCYWAQSCSTLCGPVDIASQAPLSMAFSRQEYWGGLTCPPPEDLPEPRIKLMSLMSPALAVGFFTTGTTWKCQREKDQSLNTDNTVYQKCDLGKCLNIYLWALSFPICERGTVILSL